MKGRMKLNVVILAAILLGFLAMGNGPPPVVEATGNCSTGVSWLHTDYPYGDNPWLVETCLEPGNDRDFPLWQKTPFQVPPGWTRFYRGQLVLVGTGGRAVLNNGLQMGNSCWFWATDDGNVYDSGGGTGTFLDPLRWRVHGYYCTDAPQPPVAPQPPQPAPQYACNDARDNDGDGLVDLSDPGCHSDGDAGNPNSYVWWDNDERNTYAPPAPPPSSTSGCPAFAGYQSWSIGTNMCKLYLTFLVSGYTPSGWITDYWDGYTAHYGIPGGTWIRGSEFTFKR